MMSAINERSPIPLPPMAELFAEALEHGLSREKLEQVLCMQAVYGDELHHSKLATLHFLSRFEKIRAHLFQKIDIKIDFQASTRPPSSFGKTELLWKRLLLKLKFQEQIQCLKDTELETGKQLGVAIEVFKVFKHDYVSRFGHEAFNLQLAKHASDAPKFIPRPEQVLLKKATSGLRNVYKRISDVQIARQEAKKPVPTIALTPPPLVNSQQEKEIRLEAYRLAGSIGSLDTAIQRARYSGKIPSAQLAELEKIGGKFLSKKYGRLDVLINEYLGLFGIEMSQKLHAKIQKNYVCHRLRIFPVSGEDFPLDRLKDPIAAIADPDRFVERVIETPNS